MSIWVCSILGYGYPTPPNILKPDLQQQQPHFWYQFSVLVIFPQPWPKLLGEQLKEGDIHFGSQFQRVQHMVPPSWQGHMTEKILQLMADRRWTERGTRGARTRYPWGSVPRDPFLSIIISHLLKFPETFKIAPTTWIQAPNTWTFHRMFHIQTTAVAFSPVLSRIRGSFQNKQTGLVTGPIIIRIYLEHVRGIDI